jgi:hypothetical protein
MHPTLISHYFLVLQPWVSTTFPGVPYLGPPPPPPAPPLYNAPPKGAAALEAAERRAARLARARLLALAWTGIACAFAWEETETVSDPAVGTANVPLTPASGGATTTTAVPSSGNQDVVTTSTSSQFFALSRVRWNGFDRTPGSTSAAAANAADTAAVSTEARPVTASLLRVATTWPLLLSVDGVGAPHTFDPGQHDGLGMPLMPPSVRTGA